MPVPDISDKKLETKVKEDNILKAQEESLILSKNEEFREHAARMLLALDCDKNCTFCLEEAEWGLLEGEEEGDEEDED
jgi:hypothetical protein